MGPEQSTAYAVVLSPLAVQDLAEIVTFIAADNPPAAERLGRELLQKTRLLVTFPELGKIVSERGELGNARELIHGSYRIIYRVDLSLRRVEIARFWHGSRGCPSFGRDRTSRHRHPPRHPPPSGAGFPGASATTRAPPRPWTTSTSPRSRASS